MEMVMVMMTMMMMMATETETATAANMAPIASPRTPSAAREVACQR